ncbi:hypothetical protein STEG23_013808, partial [Scotinomys teguina]
MDYSLDYNKDMISVGKLLFALVVLCNTHNFPRASSASYNPGKPRSSQVTPNSKHQKTKK